MQAVLRIRSTEVKVKWEGKEMGRLYWYLLGMITGLFGLILMTVYIQHPNWWVVGAWLLILFALPYNIAKVIESAKRLK